MKKRNRARSSSLFLLELIIAILFFSIASAACVQFFVKSHSLSQDSLNLNFAVSESSCIAETVQTSDSLKDAASEISESYPAAEIIQPDSTAKADSTDCCIYFDSGFNSCKSDEKDVSYCIRAELSQENCLITCNITVTETDDENAAGGGNAMDDDNAIYELEVNHNAQKK